MFGRWLRGARRAAARQEDGARAREDRQPRASVRVWRKATIASTHRL